MYIMKFCDKCGLKITSEDGQCPNCINNSLQNKNEAKSLIKDTLTSSEYEKLNFNDVISKNESHKSEPAENKRISPRLLLEKGGTEGREFPLYKEICNIGRWDPNLKSHPEIDLSDEDIKAKVSRHHAKITKKPEGFYIEDVGSRNGTYLNREYKLVKGIEYSLKENDEVIIGHLFLRFKL